MTVAFRPAVFEFDRPGKPSPDRLFVVDAWVSTYRKAFTAGLIQMEDWYTVMIPQVEKALVRPDVRTLVAYETEAPDRLADLYGFITFDATERPPLVYYVYTKEPYRRGGRGRLWDGPGLARQMFAAAGIDPERPFTFVCSTPAVRALELARKIPMSRWTPLPGRYAKRRRP